MDGRSPINHIQETNEIHNKENVLRAGGARWNRRDIIRNAATGTEGSQGFVGFSVQ